jgi:hypothetical protein
LLNSLNEPPAAKADPSQSVTHWRKQSTCVCIEFCSQPSAPVLADLGGLSHFRFCCFVAANQLIGSRRTNELTAWDGTRKFLSVWVTK